MDVLSSLAKSPVTKQVINELMPTVISTIKESAPMFISSMIQKNSNNQNNNYLNNQSPQQFLQQNNTPQVSEEEVLQKRKLKLINS